ncbi:MAG: GtrA family protein [Rhizobiaceae bacterium]|nr:GtrA family protein [Rhizobiaceae bacterium]
MTDMALAEPRTDRSLPGGGFALAVAGAAAVMLLAFAAGLPKLAEPGIDNDSLMRLVTVRDLLAGQGWFDPTQYRMGPEGGFAMHWSRLVDAPIALLVALFGEAVAAFVWPALLLIAALALIVAISERLGGAEARFPALVLAVTALHFLATFSPGTFDHHNVQLVLALAMLAGLLAGTGRGGLAAGAAGALSLAVGMETLPLVAAAGAGAALTFWLRGREEGRVASGFGLGFAAAAAVTLGATLSSAAWWQTTCDAYSGGHAAVAVVAGLGLAAAARFSGQRSAATRLGALAATGAAVQAVVLFALPGCLADPYADLDPRLTDYWLDWVSEAQSVATMLRSDPAQAATHYVTPLVALVLLATGAVARGNGRARLLAFLILATATIVSWWQVRGAVFSMTLAVPVLAGWIARMRGRAAADGTRGSLRLAAAWLLSFNVGWGLAVQGAAALVSPRSPDARAAAIERKNAAACRKEADFAALAGMPATTVLAISNLGAPILAFSRHRALAGPYHRNETGNLAVLDALLGPAEAARSIAARQHVGIVAICPGNPETQVLARRAPDGLLAKMLGGDVPVWLLPVETGAALQLYRIRSAIAP